MSPRLGDETSKPEAELITPGQARYHYLKHRKLPALTRQRLGAKKYDKDLRGITGDSTSMAWGPGALYMIDATIADSYLRHPWTHKPIGRPTVYLVIDVYTHMVVGSRYVYMVNRPALHEMPLSNRARPEQM